MSKVVKPKNAAIFILDDDGYVRELYLTKDQKKKVLLFIDNLVYPSKIKVSEPINGIEIINHE